MTQRFLFPTHILLPNAAVLGESPVWSVDQQVLYWVDITGAKVHRYDPATGNMQSWSAPMAVASICLNRAGRVLAALRDGFYWLDMSNGEWSLLCRLDPFLQHTRLNDGKAGPDGAFWAGSMDLRPEKEACGELFRIGADGQLTNEGGGLLVSNGLAWSPDGRTMYHSDSRNVVIYKYAFDPVSGQIGERQLFCQPDPSWGRPDGAAMDVNGCYWSCGNFAGRINQFSPSGELLGYLELPVISPTMCAFGGADMMTLFVTSMVPDSPNSAELKGPLDGTLFAIEMPVAGTEVARYFG